MRVPTDTIAAPMFPVALKWLNVATLRMDKQRGRPVLIEFWDFCDPASLRTLPYLDAWDARYGEAHGDAGLRTILVQAPGFAPGQDRDTVAAALERLGVTHPVLLDPDLALWQVYENQGWPARYLFNQDLRLFEVHFGEGGYHETEAAIQELLGTSGDLVPYVRAEDDPEARIVVPTPDVEGPYSGPYEAGEVAVVIDVAEPSTITVNGEERPVDYTGVHTVIHHDRHEAGVLELGLGDGVTCLATLFTPGLAE